MTIRENPEEYDLHTHSVYSDGTTSPAEIAAEIAELGLAGFALTDHDTMSGWEEGRAAAAEHGIDFLPGLEITTKHDSHSRHLLGYGVDPAAPELLSALERVRVSRTERAREMVRRISADYDITWEAVVGDVESRTVGRPHIADALVAKGYFENRTIAFERVLHPRSPYYIGTYAIETTEAIRLVREAGGQAVLAHPAAIRQRFAVSAPELRDLAEAGLWGVELDHPENRDDWLPPLVRQAERSGIERTGASDYHGAGKPNRLGDCRTPAQTVERLRRTVTTPR